MMDNRKHSEKYQWALLNKKRVSLPVSFKKETPNRLYTLTFRGEIVCQMAPYPVCVAKRSEKMKEWKIKNKELFEIKRN